MSDISDLEREVIIARTAEDRQKCLDIRFEVFHQEQKFSADVEIDEYDKGDKAAHFLLRLTPSLTPIGTIRCAKIAPFTYKLTRLAVLKSYRKQNLGRLLVLALHDWVKQQARMELIDNTDHRNMDPTNSANDSEQEYSNTTCPTTYGVAQTNTDDRPDGRPISRSMTSKRNTSSPTKIVTHSQIPVAGFYARFGFLPEGEQFDEDGQPHQKMVLQLPL